MLQMNCSEIDREFLPLVYDDFFSLIWSNVNNYTATINEFTYLFLFLYPKYMEPVYAINKKYRQTNNKDKTAMLNEMRVVVNERGIRMASKDYRLFINEVIMNIYMHATTSEDITKEVNERKEQEQYEKI